MIKIEAPDEMAARGLELVLRTKRQYPQRAIGLRHCVTYLPNTGMVGSWSVWRVHTGWVARWYGNGMGWAEIKGPTE